MVKVLVWDAKEAEEERGFWAEFEGEKISSYEVKPSRAIALSTRSTSAQSTNRPGIGYTSATKPTQESPCINFTLARVKQVTPTVTEHCTTNTE